MFRWLFYNHFNSCYNSIFLQSKYSIFDNKKRMFIYIADIFQSKGSCGDDMCMCCEGLNCCECITGCADAFKCSPPTVNNCLNFCCPKRKTQVKFNNKKKYSKFQQFM
jgi:hypothetical protein